MPQAVSLCCNQGVNSSLLEDSETGAYISCMLARRLLLLAYLFMACTRCAFGQLPKRLEKCLPYPTLAQEIREKQPEPKRVRVHVIRVEFDPNDGIPADAQQEIADELRPRVFEPEADSPYLKDLADEIAEVTVRGALRDRGYFKPSTTAKLTVLQSEGEDISVIVSIEATPGTQYRTGDIRIVSTDADRPLTMSPEALRALIPLQKGELFNVERVRTGLDNLTKAYLREGYVDMTPEPDTAVDDALRTVELVVKVDEQVQYRVGSIEFLGVDSMTREKLLESLPKPGEIFDAAKLDEFFKVNRAILPSDASRDDVAVERQNKMRTVRIVFDLRVCPQPSN